MKKFLSLIFGMVFLSLLPQKAWCQEAYAVLDGTTFTFYYDDLKSTREGQVFSTDVTQTDSWGHQLPEWMNVYENGSYSNTLRLKYVTNIVFDPSFVDARPTSTSFWFESCNYLEKIEGLEYLNTSEVTNMEQMFWGCEDLKEVNLSHFNTSKVKKFDDMFFGCSKLTNLDFSSFDCSSLESGCNYLFGSCGSLKSVTIADGLYLSWYQSCIGVGTPESPCVINYPKGYNFYADTSGAYFEWYSGYFKLGEEYTPAKKEAYAWMSLDGLTLTFCYDRNRSTRMGTTYDLNEGDNEPDWSPEFGYGMTSSVEKVSFEPSFAFAYPTTTKSWFRNMEYLTTIEGIEYLNTSNVTNTQWMFLNCYNLTSLDLSHFDTSNVVNMYAMFALSGLKYLDVRSFDISNAETGGMFTFCQQLGSLTISSSMSSLADDAFEYVGTPANPKPINYPEGFDFGVDTSGDYFQWKSGYFKLGESYTPAEKEVYAWMSEDGKILTFCYDSNRTTRKGTTYDLNDGTSFPEWFMGWNETSSVENVFIESSFKNARPTSTSYWFANMRKIEEIVGLNNLNTSDCTVMDCMFHSCWNLKNIDLSNFNTANCTSMQRVFVNCSGLTDIDVSSFDTSNCSNMTEMFSGCSNLETLDVSNFDTSTAKYWNLYRMFASCNNLQILTISSSMSNLGYDACNGIGTAENPCTVIAPEDFDFGVDTSGDYFEWKSGYFKLQIETIPVTISDSEYATLYYKNKILQIPEDVKAYAAKVDGKNINLTEVPNYIPAGTPVIINGPQGEYEFNVVSKIGPLKVAPLSGYKHLGEGTYIDNFFDYSTNVDIYQNIEQVNIFRIYGCFDPVNDGNADEYLQITILNPGTTIGDQTVTQEGIVYYDETNTGYYYSRYDADILLKHPAVIASTQDVSMWGYNKVLDYQIDGTPGEVQLAPFYFMDGVGGFNYSQEDNVIRIIFPSISIDNDLVGTEEDLTITDDEANKYYVLSWKDANKNKDELGFYFWKNSTDGHSMQLGAHKAYLKIPAETASNKGYLFWLPDAIEGVTMETYTESDAIYTLSGVRVNTNNLQKGIYIINGKKVVIK